MSEQIEKAIETTEVANITNDVPSNPDFNAMDLISRNNISSADLGTSNDSVNQIKIFLVAQAKNELRRIVKLTKYLDVVEDQFISVTTDLISEYPDNMTIVSETMKALTACINRSNELIAQVVSNEKLNSFVFNSSSVGDTSSGLNLESRNKVRELALKLLGDLEKENS